ncbi:MAG TPA: acyl-CoA thioesterase [Sphingobium sp.]|nr:acyl-CoA thioesterase [Sphingobium sp.]
MTALPEEQPTIRVTAMPADANFYGDIFGGWLVGQMDLAASALASRHSRGRAVLAGIEGISFLRPVRVGDEVSIYARLVTTGRSSMRIAVEAWTRERNGEAVAKVTEAIITFVAIDEDGQPRGVAAVS